MAKILVVLPLSYPLEALEEKVSSLKDTTRLQLAEREPQAIDDKATVQYENQEGVLGYNKKTFRTPRGLERAVQFWISIYSKYDNSQYVIHDTDNFVIYEVVDISDLRRSRLSAYQKDKIIQERLEDRKQKYQEILKNIHAKKEDDLNEQEVRIYNLFENVDEKNKFWKASSSSRIRSQLGQSDKFEKGIQYAGQYLPILENIFKEENLPLELTRLPFVESMFNNYARSHAGASGLWQFMPGTGRDFALRVDSTLDERNDPIKVTVAAAKLLKQNYETLKSWPLAVTAYNHGKMGMYRIANKMETNDIVEIINNYSSPTFGFASKNFYAEFLAAVHVEQDYQKYFGQLKTEKPIEFDAVRLDKYVSLASLVYYTNIDKDTLVELNPAFTSGVLRGTKLIPKGYYLRIPKNQKEDFFTTYTRIPKHQKFVQQVRNRFHRVRHGDTLAYLAKKYGTSVQAIIQLNNLDDSRFIRIGENLKIP